MELKRNRKALTDYEIIETFQAGIVLSGAEVRAAKAGLVNLEGSYVTIRNGRATLKNASIARYSKAGSDQSGYEPGRPRDLLLTGKELLYLAGTTARRDTRASDTGRRKRGSGLTIIPISLYISHRLIKIKLALARGKRKFDKRAAIKDKEFRRRKKTYGI